MVSGYSCLRRVWPDAGSCATYCADDLHLTIFESARIRRLGYDASSELAAAVSFGLILKAVPVKREDHCRRQIQTCPYLIRVRSKCQGEKVIAIRDCEVRRNALGNIAPQGLRVVCVSRLCNVGL